MKRDTNVALLTGEIASDVKVTTEPGGDRVAVVRLVSRETRSGRDGPIETADEHAVVFRGRTADSAGRTLFRGAAVVVQGSVRTRLFTDCEGVERIAAEIKADSFNLIKGPCRQGREAGGNSRRSQSPE